MINERIYLDSENNEVFIDTYVKKSESPKDAMLVIPGGGYGNVCSDREGEPIALAFAERGVNAFVLNYRVGEGKVYPAQLLDAARAIAYIKENSEKYGVDPERIFTVGFSAGGHLVGTVATKHKIAEKLLDLPENFTRPAGSVYAYPVVSARCDTHISSFMRLLGKEAEDITEEEKRFHSLECNVTRDTPPAFIWHTAKDTVVPPIGSLLLAQAYLEAGVSVTMHLYPYGNHGVALANEVTKFDNEDWIQPLAEGWVEYAVRWIKTL